MSQIIFTNTLLAQMASLSNVSLEEQGNFEDAAKSMKSIVVQVEEVLPPAGFLTIPREIRDQIYSLLYLFDGRVYAGPKERVGIYDCMGLLRVNRQVYSEAIEILYGKNTFQIRGAEPWKTAEFLNLLSSQRRDGFIPFLPGPHNPICRARFTLKKLYIPSHNININRLKHLFSLLKYFQNLEYLKVVYVASFGMKDMEVIDMCRMFMDRRPQFPNLLLWKRISYNTAENISWVIHESPYRSWKALPNDSGLKHVWKDQDGIFRAAEVVDAPQKIPE